MQTRQEHKHTCHQHAVCMPVARRVWFAHVETCVCAHTDTLVRARVQACACRGAHSIARQTRKRTTGSRARKDVSEAPKDSCARCCTRRLSRLAFADWPDALQDTKAPCCEPACSQGATQGCRDGEALRDSRGSRRGHHLCHSETGDRAGDAACGGHKGACRRRHQGGPPCRHAPVTPQCI